MENTTPNELTPKNNTETIFTADEFSMDGYDKHIRQARNACYISAALLAVNAVVLFSKYPVDLEVMWLDYLLWAFYIGGFIFCALYTKKKPYYAIIGALIVFGLFIVINAIINPSSIIGGFIFKIAIGVSLVKGLGNAKDAQEMQNQLNIK